MYSPPGSSKIISHDMKSFPEPYERLFRIRLFIITFTVTKLRIEIIVSLGISQWNIKIRGFKTYIWFIMDAAKRSIIGYQVSDNRGGGPCILAMRMTFQLSPVRNVRRRAHAQIKKPVSQSICFEIQASLSFFSYRNSKLNINISSIPEIPKIRVAIVCVLYPFSGVIAPKLVTTQK